MLFRTFTLLAALLAAGAALAQQCPPPPTPTLAPAQHEVGSHSENLNCEIAVRIHPTRAGDLVTWAQGYITGLNWGRLIAGDDARDVMHIQPPEIDHLTQVYCQQHPQDQFSFAVDQLFRNLPLVDGSQAAYQRRPRS